MTDKLRLLLVEDNPDDAELLLREIRKSGEFDPHSKTAFDKTSFIQAFCEQHWDIIICDYHLIGITAEDIIGILDDYSSNIPIVIISGSMSETQQSATPQSYLSKDRLSRIIPVIKRELQRVKQQEEILYSWGRAIDLKDHNTAGHTTRVTQLTEQLAIKLGLCWADVCSAKLGAYLHDVGKIMVPDEVLLKNGKLTMEEMEVMKNHTTYAYQMLKPMRFLRRAVEIPYCHHERWDGTGYPRGLKAHDIPLLARIFSVVDNYDAMTSERPYRGPLSEEFTLTFIYLNAGKLFDPDIVTVFINMMKNRSK